MSITEDRQKLMAMIYYEGEKETSLPLLFWEKIPDNVKSLQDMTNNKKAVISVEVGPFQENFLLGLPGLTLKQVDKVSDAILELKYGKSQAVLIDNSLQFIYMEKFLELKSLAIGLPESKQAIDNGICVKLSNKELIANLKSKSKSRSG